MSGFSFAMIYHFADQVHMEIVLHQRQQAKIDEHAGSDLNELVVKRGPMASR
ncbi:MAG: hypothetical protein ACLSA6_15280 [Holdemania massiliensis]